MPSKLGVLLWNQSTDWPAYEAAARRVDELGYDSLWAWDHLYSIYGDPRQSSGIGRSGWARPS
jgi:alkanesulfonate monooxygenase SsuD/methylene tetrahydromethanopterin reductase-like flavin-dependent oxidoreductase (luciferase family)